MGHGNKSANNRSELARWFAYQRERAYFESEAKADLRRALEAWAELGQPDGQTADEYSASLARLAELGLVTSTSVRRGRPSFYDLADWPKARARAVAKIRRRTRDNYPSRARIAAVLRISERTVYNYDRAYRVPKG